MTTENILAPLAAIETPNAAVMNTRAQSALAMVQSMVIDSSETYELAADELKAIKAKAKTIEEQRVSITGPINKALKAVNDLFRAPGEYLEQAEKIIKGKMLAYTTEQQRIADEERRRAEAVIKAEQDRLAREAAELEKAAKAEAEKLLAAGDTEKAAEVEAAAAIESASLSATALVMTAPAPQVVPAKAAGISTRSVWKATCENKAALIAFAAANPQFQNLLDVNQTALNQLAKAMRDTLEIPGVRVYEEKQLASRSS